MSLLDRLRAAGAMTITEKGERYTPLERMGRTSVAVPEHLLFNPEPQASRFGKQAVGPSRDLARIVELPRRKLDPKDPEPARKWSALLRRVGVYSCNCVEKWGFCIKELLPIQGLALEEASTVGGLLGLIGVGQGKTGVDILLPMVLQGCQRVVLLIPSNLKAQFLERDYPQWSVHFRTPQLAGGSTFTPGLPVLHVVAYSELSSAKSTDLLKKITPDTVICDEAHNVRRRDAARTKRFLRHFSENPKTRLVALSGTLTSRSLEDYAHLSKLALGEGSPLPLHWPTVEEWATAIDAERPTTIPAPMGALRKLCANGEHVRVGFRRRLVETKGVVATEEGTLGTSLILSARRPNLPPEVVQALAEVRSTWRRPDGEELTDAMTKARTCRELATGFYYRWRWPRGESKEVIERWLFARSAWHKEVREKLKHSREFMDSPLLLANAASRWFEGFTDEEGKKHPPHTRHRLTWESEHYQNWMAVKDTADPETEAVWVSDYLAHDAAEWAKEEVGIIWYEADAFGRKVAAVSGLPFFGPGEEASRKIIFEKGNRSIIASVKAHGTGKNLQMFWRNLVVSPPSSGKDIEQLLGRTHRHGQRSDEVYADFYQHTPELMEAFDQAQRDALYIAQSTGTSQKLIYAARSW